MFSQHSFADVLAVNVGNAASPGGKVQVNCELVGAVPLDTRLRPEGFDTGQVIVGFQ